MESNEIAERKEREFAIILSSVQTKTFRVGSMHAAFSSFYSLHYAHAFLHTEFHAIANCVLDRVFFISFLYFTIIYSLRTHHRQTNKRWTTFGLPFFTSIPTRRRQSQNDWAFHGSSSSFGIAFGRILNSHGWGSMWCPWHPPNYVAPTEHLFCFYVLKFGAQLQ